MEIKELMTHGAQCIRPDGSLTQAARQMKAYGIGFLPVCDAGRLVGVMTDHDIIVRALAADLDPANTAARAILTPDPVWCYEDDKVEDAAALMEGWRIRQLPVLDNDHKLVGVLSLEDIARPKLRREYAGAPREKTSHRRSHAPR